MITCEVHVQSLTQSPPGSAILKDFRNGVAEVGTIGHVGRNLLPIDVNSPLLESSY